MTRRPPAGQPPARSTPPDGCRRGLRTARSSSPALAAERRVAGLDADRRPATASVLGEMNATIVRGPEEGSWGTRLDATPERYPGACCFNAKSFMSPTFWPTLNTRMQARRLAAFARFSASRSCEKDRRLG